MWKSIHQIIREKQWNKISEQICLTLKENNHFLNAYNLEKIVKCCQMSRENGFFSAN